MCSNPSVGIGLACFVKTPGRSPVKTRLAASIGQERATQLYELSVACLQETLRQATSAGIGAVWAVAEKEELMNPCWSGLPVVLQHGATLGERLHSVYSQLLETYGMAMVVGSDSPQLSVERVVSAKNTLEAGSAFVMGPAIDGGFYLLGGRQPIPAELWAGIAYSTPTTGKDLLSALWNIAPVAMFPRLGDLDESMDIQHIRQELEMLGERNPAQEALRRALKASERTVNAVSPDSTIQAARQVGLSR